jgi:CheY-like chemotaxis protein
MPKRVLVVDDERCIADTLAAILRNSGYEAIASYDAQSALLQCESANPDLVISDVFMPGMNGIEMAILLRERHPDCKILLFSGVAASVDLLEEAREQGHDFELIEKPIHPAELLVKLAGGPATPPSRYRADSPKGVRAQIGDTAPLRPQKHRDAA